MDEGQTPGAERLRITDALTAAFDGDATGLDRVAIRAFGQRLVTVVGDGPLRDQAFRLVGYAEQRSTLPDLIAAARAENPTNAALRALAGDTAAELAAPAPRLHPSLPHPTLFLGREAEVEALTAALRASGGRLAAIIGLGGFGKSTLAAHVARALAGQPFAAVVWSSAADAPGWTLDTLLRDFAVLEPSIGQQPTPEGQRAAALAALAASPTLLIADNLESLTDATEQRRLVSFLRAFDPAGGSRALLTTRHEADWLHEILAAPGGKPLPALEGLDPAAAVALMRQLGAEKGLAALTAAPDATLAPLVAAVGHSPKLIELLVGLGNWDRIREVAQRLPRELRRAQDALLADAFERLRATPGALELVQQVPVFVPSADFAALRDVAGANLPAGVFFDDALDAACATALLSRAPAPDGSLRYRLHPLVARYLDATDALRPPDALLAAARRAHAAYFARFAAEHWDAIMNEEHRTALDREWGNLQPGWREAQALHQAALEAGAADGAQAAAEWVVSYGRGLRYFVILRGFWTEGRILLEAGVAAAQEVGDKHQERAQLFDAATLAMNQGSKDVAHSLYEQSLDLARQLDDKRGEGAGLYALAGLEVQGGDPVAAHTLYEQSLAIARHIKDVQLEAATLHQMANLDEQAGERVKARRRYDQSLVLRRSIDDIQGEAATLHNLANLDEQEGDLLGARIRYAQSLTLKSRIGDVQGEAATLRNLGNLDMRALDREGAQRNFAQSLALFQRCGDMEGQASVQVSFGGLLCEEGKWNEGLEMLLAAVANYGRVDMIQDSVWALREWARYKEQAPPEAANPSE